jgi:integrase
MMSGVNTHRHLIRNRSSAYISESARVITRFLEALRNNRYNIEKLEINSIGNDEVEFFHDYLVEKFNNGSTYYNKHFVIMKTFFNWAIENDYCSIKNPFLRVELSFEKKEKTIIKKEEFNHLLSVINFENGWEILKDKKRRNHFKPWLKDAIRFAIETGIRREELFWIKWNDIEEIEKGVQVIKINNLKVNRIQFGKDKGKYVRHIPVTQSLLVLIKELGLDNKTGSNEFIFQRNESASVKNMMNNLSIAFGHFIKQVTTRKIEFKDLRKTYITKLVLVLGDKAKMFTGQTNNEIIKDHYLSEAYLAGSLNNFEIF